MQSSTPNKSAAVPKLQAIGTAVPQFRIPQNEHEAILLDAAGTDRRQSLTIRKVYAGSGIDYRHSVLPEFGAADNDAHVLFRPLAGSAQTTTATRMSLYEQHAMPLLEQAVQNCFDKLEDFAPATITHVITFSCTGMTAPGLDIAMINAFGIAPSAERTCINFMGCYAAINALKTAAHICRSEPEAIVLIAGAELCSLHYLRSTDPEQLVANAIFSDGAAAGIVSSRHISRKHNALALSLDQFYAEFENEGATDMVWRVGDYGFELRLSADVPSRLEAGIHRLVQKLLDKQNKKLEDVQHYAIHPGGVRILQACEAGLGISKEQNATSYEVLREYGNMSSVTVLFVLERYLQLLDNAGESVLACAFGPGLTMEAMLLSTSE